jgi:hypothetical protein
MTGASVMVKLAGKNAATATIFADQNSGGTLANPYTTTNGKVGFWLAAQQAVDITVTPTVGSPATVANQQAAAAVPQHQTMGFAGKVTNWFQS